MGRTGKVLTHVVASGLALWLGQDVAIHACDAASFRRLQSAMSHADIETLRDHREKVSRHNLCSLVSRVAKLFSKQELPKDLGQLGDSSTEVPILVDSAPPPGPINLLHGPIARCPWPGPTANDNLNIETFYTGFIGRRFVVSSPLRGPPVA